MGLPHAVLIQSFPPIAGAGCRVLVLGSVPGVASLNAGQYYAHPRNTFWPIIRALFPDVNGEYPARCQMLLHHGVALWDVLASCERPGSLDQNIRAAIPNDIPSLLEQCPRLHAVCLNGGAALRYYRKHFSLLPLSIHPLPSTSPAAARLRLEEKLEAWTILKALAELPITSRKETYHDDAICPHH